MSDAQLELVPEYLNVEKAHEITVAGMTIAGVSRQPDENDPFTPEEAIQPPLDLDQLARLSQTSATRNSIIEAIARNTVGLGYTIEVAEGHEEEVADPREEARELKALLEALARRDLRMDAPSFTDQLLAVKRDEEEVGNGYLEVSRNKITGMIDGTFHIPGKRVRRKADRTGYVIVDDAGMPRPDLNRSIDFYNFGDKAEYDDEGNPTGVRSDRNPTRNELISFRLYSSESRDYGLPRDVGLALEYLGDKLAAEFNASFFDSGGTPPTVIFVTGEETELGGKVRLTVPQETVQRIAETLKSDAGHQKRVAIIPLPPGADASTHQLGQVSDRDMGFVQYRRDNVRRALAAFRVSPIFLASTEETGRYTAEVERAITLEQVFDPEQRRYEERLGQTLLKDLGYAHMALKFKRLAIENDAAKRESAMRLAEAAVITVREYREAHGKGPLPEAGAEETPETGQFPHGINDRLVTLGRPRGAENRNQESDQRGLRPGIGAREQRSTDAELERARQEAVSKAMDATTQAVTRALEQAARITPDVHVEVPVTVEKGTTSKKVVRDEDGFIAEIIETDD